MTALLKNIENNYLNIKNLKNNSKVSTFTKSAYLLWRSLCLKQSDKPRQYIVPSETIGCLIKFLTHWYRFPTTMCENAFTWMRRVLVFETFLRTHDHVWWTCTLVPEYKQEVNFVRSNQSICEILRRKTEVLTNLKYAKISFYYS